MNWSQFVDKVPWIATVQTYNNDWTIYACLQQAIKQFDFIAIIDDGSTDNTMLEIDRFIRRENPKNIQVFDLSSFDPWPNLTAPKREGMEIVTKTQSKAKFKTHNLARQLDKNAMWVSIESDVILFDNARKRMIERVKRWDNPYHDCEFFNIVMAIDPWHVRSVSKSEEEYIKPDGIKHRKEYDHPGDWGLAVSWLGGELYPGPDPSFPYGPCFLPWNLKNQTEKKGQDDTSPYGMHMLSYREAERDADYSTRRFLRIEDIKDDEVDWDIFNRVRFPVISKLDEQGKREILSCEL